MRTRRYVFLALIALFLACLTSYFESGNALESAYEKGYEDGYSDGWIDGETSGGESVYEYGYNHGFNEAVTHTSDFIFKQLPPSISEDWWQESVLDELEYKIE